MILYFAIGLIVGVAILNVIGVIIWNWDEEFAFGGWATVAFFVFMIWGIGSMGYYQTAEADYTKVNEHSELQVLVNDETTEWGGSFFLGIGSGGSDTDPVINYVLLHEGGYSTVEQMPLTNEVRIYEDNPKKPYYEQTEGVILPNVWFPWEAGLGYPSQVDSFHVPEGSIIKDYYNIDITDGAGVTPAPTETAEAGQ